MNKLFKRCLAVCVLSATAVTGLMGCKGDKIDYDHTIIFYSTQGDNLQKVTVNAINIFEEKYPGWKIKHTNAGGYDECKNKIVQDLQGNIQPDLAYCYPDHVAQYIQTGKVVDMNKLLKDATTTKVPTLNQGTKGFTDEKEVVIGYTAAELDDFVEGFYVEGYGSNFGGATEYGYKDDSMLTLPFIKSTELLYYNATVLEELGLEPAQTWDELWAQAKVIKAKYPKVTPLGYDSESNWFITMCEQNGWGYTSAAEPYYLFNNEGTKGFLGQLNELWEDGLITTQTDYGAYTSNLFGKGTDGGCVYCVGSSGGASYQKPAKKGDFEVGIAPIPGSIKDSKTNKTVISQGPSLVMLECGRTKNVELKQKMTMLFVKELLDTTFQAEFSTASGYNPVRKTTYDLDGYVEHLDKWEENITAYAAKVAKTMTEDFFTSPAFVGSSNARNQVGSALVAAMTGQKTPEKALADAMRNCGAK